MHIDRLDLRAFGSFTDVSIDLSAGPRRFHIVYGPNESGKSTSLRAITSLLFGMPHRSEDNYVHGNSQLRVGAALVDSAGNRIECVRRRGQKATLRDAEDNEPIDESDLSRMLGGIDRETFTTRFGISHAELIAGGAQILDGHGDLGHILFAAGAGVSRLRQLQDHFDDVAASQFSPRGTKPTVNVAITRFDEQRRELRELQVAPQEFAQLRSQIDEQERDARRLSSSIAELTIKLARRRNYEQALPIIPSWRSTISELGKLSSTPILDESFTERRRQAASDLEVSATSQVELGQQIQSLSEQLSQLPTDTKILDHEAEIQLLFQEIAACDKAELDRANLARLLGNSERKIIELLRELSVDIDFSDESRRSELIEDAVHSLQVSESLRGRVRELASSYERLIQQRNDASDAVETTKRRLLDTSTELEAMKAPGDPAVLSSAIESVGDPESLLDAIAEGQSECRDLNSRCNSLLDRLVGFDGSVREAVAIAVPNPSIVAGHAERLATASHRIEQSKANADRLRAERDSISRQLESEQSALRLPTSEQLVEARALRDRAIDRLSDSQVDRKEIQKEILEQTRRADDVVDVMREHHQQIHERIAIASQLRSLDSRVAEAESQLRKEMEAEKETKSQWLELWEALGIRPAAPERMQQWIADHGQLGELASRLTAEESRLEKTRVRIARAAGRLRKVLAAVGSKHTVGVGSAHQGDLFDEINDEEDLSDLYAQALELRNDWSKARRQYDARVHRRDELSKQLPDAETRFDSCQKNVEQWRENWQSTTQSFVRRDRSTTGEVLQMLDQLRELDNRKKDRDIQIRRIEAIGRDRAAFEARVERLMLATSESKGLDRPDAAADDPARATHSPAPATHSPARATHYPARATHSAPATGTAAAQALYGRLQTERSAAQQRDSLKMQMDATNKRLAETAIQRSTCEIVLKQLCEEAGCDSPEQLPEIERLSRERRNHDAVLRDLENQLSILAGNEPLQDFIDAASDRQPALLKSEIEQYENQLNEFQQRLTSVQQEIGAVRHQFDAVDGSSRAAELSQSMQMTAANITIAAEQYAKAKVASLLLRRAIDHYRMENQSPVLALAQQFFQTLTQDEYSGLKVDFNAQGKSILIGVRADLRTDVPAGGFSTGTADALYLALRLASLQHQLRHSEPIPLIIDDCLVQLDDSRAAAALKAFSEVSLATQVVLFTHHRHLLRLAEQELDPSDFHVHELLLPKAVG